MLIINNGKCFSYYPCQRKTPLASSVLCWRCLLNYICITLTTTSGRNNSTQEMLLLAHSFRCQPILAARAWLSSFSLGQRSCSDVVHVTKRIGSIVKGRNLVTAFNYASLETCFLCSHTGSTVPKDGAPTWEKVITMMISQCH